MLSIENAEYHINRLKRIAKAIEDADKNVVKVASQVRNNIEKRTVAGKDFKSDKMPPLSDPYRKYKKRKGKKPFRNMLFTGNTLKGMQVEKVPGGADIFFADEGSENIARWNDEGTGKIPAAKFFSFSKEDEKYMEEKLSSSISKEVL